MIPWKHRLEPYEKQRAAMFDPPRHSIITASPKSGKTISALNWLIQETEAIDVPNARFLWIAPVLGQADIAFRRGYQEVLWVHDVELHKTNRTITLPDSSVVTFRSADKPDLIYGEDYWAVVVDEASRMHVDAWVAAQSTLNHTSGRIRIITNAVNTRNWAYKLADKVRKGALADWEHHALDQSDAIEAGIVTEAQDTEARALLPDAVYRTLYLNEVGDSGGIRINVDKLTHSPVPEVALKARAWDLAVTEGGDWTVGALVAANSDGYWVVDIVRERRQPNEVIDLIRQTAAMDGPEVEQVIEEEKGASGSLFVETLRRELDAIPTAGAVYPAGVEQNKIIRAWPLVAQVGGGRYHLAPDLDAGELLPELDEWPDAPHDDQVDALAHAHNHLVPMVQGMIGGSWVPGQAAS